NGKNYYPNKNLAAHVVGFTGENGKGVTGAEAMLDSSGTDNNITLTIDKNIQKVAEDALKKAMEDYKPRDGASAIIMDPATGEILAMVSMPDFDPNMPMTIPGGMDEGKWKGMTEIERKDYLSEKVLKNKTISETYEPASSFKTITAAAGLEEGIVKPDSPVDDTPVKVDQWTISCWTPKGHGKETFAEAVYNSCSPVFVRISQSLGTERFYRYLQSFGFMDKTNLGLPGEARSIFHTKPTNIDLATASFGQRVQVTPIQLTAAYGAIANGGRLLKPQIIREITDAKGQSVKRYEPEVIREVLSKQTSNALKEILEGSVSKGTGANAFMKGYRIAGKTGTAETPESKTKGIYIASFIGFAPADDPRIVCQVILNGPQVNENTGGMTAAPVSGKIMKDVLDYLAQ
ncbi:MAG: penicillin-binding transpeptidase domain-containing protein, partial [Clostridia bacterium]|nr:penicillin-binding transpeptidase domain-containing protein [Clostridia bacterium]